MFACCLLAVLVDHYRTVSDGCDFPKLVHCLVQVSGDEQNNSVELYTGKTLTLREGGRAALAEFRRQVGRRVWQTFGI